MNGLGDEREGMTIQTVIQDRMDFEKVGREKRCNTLLDGDWLEPVEVGPAIGHMR